MVQGFLGVFLEALRIFLGLDSVGTIRSSPSLEIPSTPPESKGQSHNQRHYDLVIMKTGLFPTTIFFINPVAYNLVMSRLSELKAEVEVLNQS